MESTENKTATRGAYEAKGKKRIKKYRARIMIDGKRISLGYFNTIEEAHDAYNEYKKNH